MEIKKKPIILLAEDEKDLQEVYIKALTGWGFDVILAKDGTEVSRRLKNKYDEIDLIVLDIVMPKMDGFDALRKLKKNKKYKKIPVIMSTSLSDDQDRKEALNIGAEKYFVKSDRTPTELAKDISRILTGYQEKYA